MKTILPFLFAITLLFGATNSARSQWVAADNGLTDFHLYSIVSQGSDIFVGGIADLYHSNDNGSNWTKITPDTVSGNYIALHSNGIYLYASSQTGGIFRTSNNGVNWTFLGLKNSYSNAITTKDTFLFAATFGSGLMRSSDNGATWKAVNAGLTDLNLNAITVSGQYLFTGNYKGIFRSSDNGDHWENVNTGFPVTEVISIAAVGSTIFAGTDSGNVYRSPDNGDHWVDASTELGKKLVWSIAGVESNIFAGTFGAGFYRSSNTGVTWVAENNNITDADVRGIAIIGKDIFIATDGNGVFHRPLSDFGIQDVKRVIADISGITVSPNPSQGIITISSNGDNISHLTITNILGERLIEISKPNTSALQLDLSSLPSGSYVVALTTNSGIITKKIIKQ